MAIDSEFSHKKWGFSSSLCKRLPEGIHPFSYGFPMVFLWFSYGFPIIFPLKPPFSYGFPMVLATSQRQRWSAWDLAWDSWDPHAPAPHGFITVVHQRCSICSHYVRLMFQGIYPQNMAEHMVLTYLHFRILEFPLTLKKRAHLEVHTIFRHSHFDHFGYDSGSHDYPHEYHIHHPFLCWFKHHVQSNPIMQYVPW